MTRNDASLADRAMPLEPSLLLRALAGLDAEAWRAAATLWLESWLQAPLGSLPADDLALAALAGLGARPDVWGRVREAALAGWSAPCADGRRYHPEVSRMAFAALGAPALPAPAPAAAPRKRGRPAMRPSSLPQEWADRPDAILDDQKLLTAALNAGLTYEEARHETGRFADYNRANGKTYADWSAAWAYWCGNAVSWRQNRGGPIASGGRGSARGGGSGGLVDQILRDHDDPPSFPFRRSGL